MLIYTILSTLYLGRTQAGHQRSQRMFNVLFFFRYVVSFRNQSASKATGQYRTFHHCKIKAEMKEVRLTCLTEFLWFSLLYFCRGHTGRPIRRRRGAHVTQAYKDLGGKYNPVIRVFDAGTMRHACECNGSQVGSRNCRQMITGLTTGAALLENNGASTKLTTANGGTFLRAQVDSVANHVTARSICK